MLMYYQNRLSAEDSGLTAHSKTGTVAAGFKIKIFSTAPFSLWGCWCTETPSIHLGAVCRASFGASPSFHRLLSGPAEHEVSPWWRKKQNQPRFPSCFFPSPQPCCLPSPILTSTVQTNPGLRSTSPGGRLRPVPASPLPQPCLLTSGHPGPLCAGLTLPPTTA